jgi:hypothetical protein
VQSVPITTKVVSLNPVHGEVYSIHHYVIKFVSDLRQVGGLLFRYSGFLTNKTDCHNITEILLKVALNTINQPTNRINWKIKTNFYYNKLSHGKPFWLQTDDDNAIIIRTQNCLRSYKNRERKSNITKRGVFWLKSRLKRLFVINK